MPVRISVNNQELTTQATVVQQLAEQLDLPEKGVALAINNRVIPRAVWSETPVQENDSVVVIKAAFGG